MDARSVIWSEAVYKLKDLQKHFQLPQLVCVEDGYYDEKDETTLSRDDILTLHLQQKSRFYKAVSKNGQEINVPVNLEVKVETVSDKQIRKYHSIQELVEVSAKRVKSIHNHPWLKIEAGDILEVQGINNEQDVERLRCSFINKQQEDCYIPITYKAVYEVVPEITELWLMEVEKTFTLPIKIRFIDKTLQVKQAADVDISTIADLGEVTLQTVQEIDIFIASTRNENMTSVLKIPASIDITVRAGIGVDEGDYTYADVCQFYHDRARLDQLDGIEVESIRIGENEFKVERIYEFVDEFSDVEGQHDYEDMAPPIPSRINREPLHPNKEESDTNISDDESSNGDSDNYEDVVFTEEPPPIPVRIESAHKSNTKSSREGLCERLSKALFGSRENNNSTKTGQLRTQQKADIQGRYVKDSTIRSKTPKTTTRRSRSEDVEHASIERKFTIPDRLEVLTVEEVAQCLKLLNMGEHVEEFRNKQINGSLLAALNDDELTSLGLNKFHRTKLLKFISGWRPD